MTSHSETEALTYASVGVDVEAKSKMLAKARRLLESTHGPEVASGIGPFAGLYKLPHGDGWIAASADGVGTKTKVAIAAGKHRGIGLDIVNHCVNDIAVAGARPLFFLDYFASGRLDPDVFAQVVEGLVKGCHEAGCALLGGETAEMPDVYALGDYDLAGFIVGLVEPDTAIDVKGVRAGDVLVGLPSSGLHTNGYALARKVFEDVPVGHVYKELGRPLDDVLLEPHRSYLPELNRLRGGWKSAAHITGGGYHDNVPRALPDGLAAEFKWGSWEVPPVFDLIARLGRIDLDEMRATFNLGLGMVLVCPEPIEGLPTVGRVVEQSGPKKVLFV